MKEEKIKPYECPKCKKENMVIVKDLEKHNLEENEGYEVVECYDCHSFFKVFWKFWKRIELGEKE
jgi:DNA-directed RNA polymerase subunit RPC12/RpoP